MNALTKSGVMDLVARGLAHESFEHTQHGLFDVTEMRLHAPELGEKHLIDLAMVIPHLQGDEREVDMSRVRSLDPHSWLYDPAMFIQIGETDGVPDVIMVDGHHRAMRRHLEGLTDMEAWLIPIDKVIRPNMEAMIRGPEWGEKEIKDGKLVPRGG